MTTAAQETQRILLDHEFPSTPATVSIVRHATARVLTAWGLAEAQTNDCVLVVSELVTNAIEARSQSVLKLRLSEEVLGTLTVEVWDAVPEPPCLRSPEHDAEDGRGLLIVAALATHYGWRPTRRGKWVFAVLAISPLH
ncbi:ATP-binding protein [Spirillospora sp. CA-294931]|uniref:ATP-binding protein n=1 Tax=Spirillospora sp. CA-294931 TaxID=3240042 RepID=UPI003D8C86B8